LKEKVGSLGASGQCTKQTMSSDFHMFSMYQSKATRALSEESTATTTVLVVSLVDRRRLPERSRPVGEMGDVGVLDALMSLVFSSAGLVSSEGED
jgi:hypothetical protein